MYLIGVVNDNNTENKDKLFGLTNQLIILLTKCCLITKKID